MRYKVGDTVKVKSLNYIKTHHYKSPGSGGSYLKSKKDANNSQFNCVCDKMLRFCGRKITITETERLGYRIKEDNSCYMWTDWMFEDEDYILDRKLSLLDEK